MPLCVLVLRGAVWSGVVLRTMKWQDEDDEAPPENQVSQMTDEIMRSERMATVRKLRRDMGTASSKGIYEQAVEGNVSRVRAFLNMAIDQKNSKAIDERSAGLGRSLLHEACAYGHRPLVICLVEEFDADIHKRTLLGRDTPIHLAARHGFRPIVFILLQCVPSFAPRRRRALPRARALPLSRVRVAPSLSRERGRARGFIFSRARAASSPSALPRKQTAHHPREGEGARGAARGRVIHSLSLWFA